MDNYKINDILVFTSESTFSCTKGEKYKIVFIDKMDHSLDDVEVGFNNQFYGISDLKGENAIVKYYYCDYVKENFKHLSELRDNIINSIVS